MVSYCANEGVKIIPLIEPLPGDRRIPMYNEANADLHFIKDNTCATVRRQHLSRPDVVVRLHQHADAATGGRAKISNWLNTFPVAGIWNDIDEPEDGDQIPYNGLLWCDGRYGTSTTDTRRQWCNEHNYFGLRCASHELWRPAAARTPNKRPFVLSRSGNCGLQRYAVSWSGDTARQLDLRPHLHPLRH